MTKQEKFDLIVRARDEASAALGGITKNLGLMVAGFAAVRTVTTFLKDSIAAASEAEIVWNDLAASVERHGMSWASVESSVVSFTSTMQEATGTSDEAIAKSIQAFLDYGATVEQAQARVKVALDLSAGGHMALSAATDLVAKASVGYTATLSRYGIILDESIPKSEKFKKAVEQINERFGGAAAARMATYAGQVDLLAERWGDFQETIGALLTGDGGALKEFVEDLSTAVSYLNTQVVASQDTTAGYEAQLRLLKAEVAGTSGEFGILNDVLGYGKIALDIYLGALFPLYTLLSFGRDTTQEFTRSLDEQGEQLELLIQISRNFDAAISKKPIVDPGAGENIALTAEELQKLADKIHQLNASLPIDLGPVIGGYETIRTLYNETGIALAQFNDQTAQQDAMLGDIPGRVNDIAGSIGQLTKEQLRAKAAAEEFALTFRDILAGNVGDGIADMFLEFQGFREGLQEIFQGIAEDFIRMVINAIVSALATKLVTSIIGTAIPGGNIFTSLLGLGKLGPEPVGGASVSPSGLAASASQNVQIIFNGPVLGEAEYVRKVFAPALERDARLNINKIALKV